MNKTHSQPPAQVKAFLYPNMPREWGDGDVVDRDGKNYYRNIYASTNRVRVTIQTRDPTKVEQHLDSCLRGEADLWWKSQLDNFTRAGLIAMPGIEDYCQALEHLQKHGQSTTLRGIRSTTAADVDQLWSILLRSRSPDASNLTLMPKH